jgi:hypothetical protein
VPDPLTVGPGDVEAVIPHVGQRGQFHQALQGLPVTAADDRDRASLRQFAHRRPHLLGHDREFGPLDDRGQRAVVIEKHGDAPALQERADFVQAGKRRGNLVDAAAAQGLLGIERDVLEIGDHDIGPTLYEGLGPARAVDPDDELELPGTRGFYP